MNTESRGGVGVGVREMEVGESIDQELSSKSTSACSCRKWWILPQGSLTWLVERRTRVERMKIQSNIRTIDYGCATSIAVDASIDSTSQITMGISSSESQSCCALLQRLKGLLFASAEVLRYCHQNHYKHEGPSSLSRRVFSVPLHITHSPHEEKVNASLFPHQTASRL